MQNLFNLASELSEDSLYSIKHLLKTSYTFNVKYFKYERFEKINEVLFKFYNTKEIKFAKVENSMNLENSVNLENINNKESDLLKNSNKNVFFSSKFSDNYILCLEKRIIIVNGEYKDIFFYIE